MMKKYMFALLALLSMAGCSVDDGDVTADWQLPGSDAATYDDATLTFDGAALLRLHNPPVAEWARLAGISAAVRPVADGDLLLDVSPKGWSNSGNIYHVAAERLVGDRAFSFTVVTADGEYRLWPEFGDDSELVVNDYLHTLTLALTVKAIHVVGGASTTLGPAGRVFVFSGTDTPTADR